MATGRGRLSSFDLLPTEADYIAEAKAEGANFVGVGIDVLLYVQAMRDLAARYK